jgi:hypothetical protein
VAFVHLHTHSEYSLLDGANRIPELVAHVKAPGHGLARRHRPRQHARGVVVLRGVEEAGASARSSASRPTSPSARGRRRPSPLGARAVLAPRAARPNRQGYKNLIKLSPPSATPRGSTAGRASTRRCSPRHATGWSARGLPLGRGGALPATGSLRQGARGGALVRRAVRAGPLLPRDPGSRHPRGGSSSAGCSSSAATSASGSSRPTTRTT